MNITWHGVYLNDMTKKLIIMMSPAGGGKSTKAKTLTHPDYICEADDYWLNCVGDYLFVPEKIGKAHKWCQDKVRGLMEKGITCIVCSNTNITRKDRQPYVELAKNHGYSVSIEFPDSPWFKRVLPKLRDKTFNDRDINDFVHRNTHSVPFEAIKRMFSRWEED